MNYVAGLGGGRVEIMAGIYTMNHALFLRSGIQLVGSGPDTVLRKRSGRRQVLIRDVDWYEARVDIAEPSDYWAGAGIMLRSYVGDTEKLQSVVRETVTRVDGNTLSLSGRLGSNMWLEDHACAAPLFPLLSAHEETHDIRVENLTLDGNREENEEINGNYSGGIFIQRCDRWTFQNVTSRNYHGDGFSFQVCDDIHFDDCRSEGNANLGFHPGSGSQRPVFRNCVSTGNNQGIFFCWGVSDGLVDGCTCSDNRDYGISVGHRDTDNRIQKTIIERNHKVGILFRDQEAFRAGHRNSVSACTIRDNGFGMDGVGVDVRGQTHDITLRENVLSDSGQGRQKIGVRIGARCERVDAENNTFSGLDMDIDRVPQTEERAP